MPPTTTAAATAVVTAASNAARRGVPLCFIGTPYGSVDGREGGVPRVRCRRSAGRNVTMPVYVFTMLTFTFRMSTVSGPSRVSC
ncbi:hypothetical protein Adi01nite_50570 [Amorphoplanes digitatis]|nr:hypothetical protein Adi01nite_50570 [Actinoplanes digitatis]